MYQYVLWKDHAVDPANTYKMTENADGTITLTRVGKVIQQGTNLSAANFTRMEEGILDATIAAQILGFGNLHQQRQNDEHMGKIDAAFDAEILGETKTVTLTNTAAYPFNSTADSPTTVALTTTRKNLYYTVEATVADHSGEVGEIRITDKALNGFKVSFDGSGKSVTLTLRVKGGMT